VTDLSDPNYDILPDYSFPITKGKAMELRSARQRLHVKRNDLLVSIHVVNSIEQELIRAEWMNWLLEENYMCREVARRLTEADDEVISERIDDIVLLRRYCDDCNQVWDDTRGQLSEID